MDQMNPLGAFRGLFGAAIGVYVASFGVGYILSESRSTRWG